MRQAKHEKNMASLALRAKTEKRGLFLDIVILDKSYALRLLRLL